MAGIELNAKIKYFKGLLASLPNLLLILFTEKK